jgi:hypothetical protein
MNKSENNSPRFSLTKYLDEMGFRANMAEISLKTKNAYALPSDYN